MPAKSKPSHSRAYAGGNHPVTEGLEAMLNQPRVANSGRGLDVLDELARVSGMGHASMAMHVASRRTSGGAAAAAAEEKAKAEQRLAKLNGGE